MSRFFALVFAIIAGVAGSQAPGFTLQYMQNLTGRVDVLKPIVDEFDQKVQQYGYTRTRALEECKLADGLLEALCSGYAKTMNDYITLKAHLDKLQAASSVMRPITLAQSYRREIVDSAWSAYKPAVPTTTDGAVYGGGSFVIIWLILSILFGGLGSLFGGGRRKDYAY